MRLSIPKSVLAKGLTLVHRTVAAHGNRSVAGNVLLEAGQGQIKLAATDGELSVVARLDSHIEQDGAIAIPAHLLTGFVKWLPEEQIDMALQERTRTLYLRCAHHEANIKGIDATLFPDIPTYHHETHLPTARLPAAKLRQMIHQVVFAAATDDVRPALTGIYTRLEDDRLHLVATDGFRMALRSAPLTEPSDLNIDVIVPARALRELARLIDAVDWGEEDGVQMMIAEARNQIVFHLPGMDLVSQLIEANFPHYIKLIPTTYTTRVVLNTAAFLQAVQIAHLFVRDGDNKVSLQIIPGDGDTGKLIITAVSAEMGDNVAEIEATVEGEPMSIAFNAGFLLDALRAIDTPRVVFETISASRPGVIRPIDADIVEHGHVIMPMTL